MRLARSWIIPAILAAAVAVTGAALAPAEVPEPAVKVVVYKSPTCGCCTKWVEYLRERGFDVEANDMEDVSPIKRRYGVGDELISCHTALVEGYVIEGHVPAEDIQRLLRERPRVTGLTVPGMVTGSPGMEGPNPQPYQVLAFDRQGKTVVWAKH